MADDAQRLADAWKLLLDRRDSRDRWERYVEEAENQFADLADELGMVWSQAVETASDVLGINQNRAA